MYKFIYVFLVFLLLSLFFPVSDIFALESFECTAEITFSASGGANQGDSIPASSLPACTSIDTGELGFKIPSLGDLLTFAIRAFFVIAGLAALFYLLLGALAWVTSGGDKDAVTAAREKIQAAVLGMILVVAVLAIIWTLEQVIFNRRICLGLSCPLTLPGLIETLGEIDYDAYGNPVMETENANCCVCLKDDGTFGDRINTFTYECDGGTGAPL